MRTLPLMLGASIVLAATPHRLPAQVLGIPVRNAGVTTGIGIAGEVGFPNSDFGKGKAFGASGQIGLGPIGFTASVASYDPKGAGDKITSLGATANFKVFGGPLIPFSVTLQGGAGYWDEDEVGGKVKYWHFPVGLGLGLNIPNPVLAIRPWIAPRLDVLRESNGSSETSTDFGISGGVDLNLLSGLGFRASYDWVSHEGQHPAVFAVGAHYVFKVPGL